MDITPRKSAGSRARSLLGRMPWLTVAVGVLLMLVPPLASSAASVSPTQGDNKTTCADLGLDLLAKFNPPHSSSANGVTLTVTDHVVDWSSTTPVGAVIVKGGPVANIYTYQGATSDTDLTPPINPNDPNNKPYGLSQVRVCAGEASSTPASVDVSVAPNACTFTTSPITKLDVSITGDGSATVIVEDGDGNTVGTFDSSGSMNLAPGHYTWSTVADEGSVLSEGSAASGEFDAADCTPAVNTDNGGTTHSSGSTHVLAKHITRKAPSVQLAHTGSAAATAGTYGSILIVIGLVMRIVARRRESIGSLL